MKRTKFFAIFSALTTLLLASCDQASSQAQSNHPQDNQAQNSETLVIATKPMTEQFILSEMLALLIEKNSSLSVTIKKGIGGGTANIHPALLKGEIDLYPEYTGTAWLYVLKKPLLSDDQALFKQLSEDYAKQFGLAWVGLYGFNNTYGLAIRKALAEQHQIRSYSELAAYSKQYTFGAEYDFYEREDGYSALAKTYDFDFGKQVDLDIGLKYQAINSGKIDVMNIFTTDGQLTSPNITVLTDDKQFYPNYYAGTVIRLATLEKHPELKAILMKMDNLISNQEMAQLNHQVEQEGRNEHEVAETFLKSKGLLQ